MKSYGSKIKKAMTPKTKGSKAAVLNNDGKSGFFTKGKKK